MTKHFFALQLACRPLLAMLLAIAFCGLVQPVAHADTIVRTSSFEYDPTTGFLIKEIVEPDTPNSCLQTVYAYDTYGNKTSASSAPCTGASGTATWSAGTRTVASSYGSDGRFPVTSTNALSQSESKQYDARFGAVTSLTGPNGLTTTWVYDGFGRKTRENRADGTYSTWQYLLCTDAGANCDYILGGPTIAWVMVESSFAANNSITAPSKRHFYDLRNRVVRSRTRGFDSASAAPPTIVQDTRFNSLGQVASKSNLYVLDGSFFSNPQWTTFAYDALGRVTQQYEPDQNGNTAVTTFAYNGLTTTVTNAKNQTKTTTKNAQGQVALVTDALNNTIVYTYDALGQLKSTNAEGSTTTMAYNQRGQKTSMQDPAMGAWEYRYNVYGELVWQRDSLGQASTLEYDALGRMTKRTEPDLVSQWSYDKKFDGNACGKGVGKLCEAKSDNGYDRIHTYDSLGRASSTSTVLDNPSVPAVVSVAFDAVTGRVASKTWPTGYQANYQYSSLGYLKTVTGGGTAGFSQTVTFEVLAMNERGQITQYRQGGQITTVRNFDTFTGRLNSQNATKTGQTTGNVLNQTYSYDSLGSLLTRVDANTGVSESFSYDNVNRLNHYTALGGSLTSSSPNYDVQVLYDARGNIVYKSDVGHYWYDGARPNRMTQVTLDNNVAGAQALKGTRALSYAFDDYKSGAQTVNGIALGNGNLWYTVSQDIPNSRSTVRWEDYTSFNMPSQIRFGSLLDINNPTATTADRTLTFVYGPEHQRIKQQVQLSSNGTSAYSAGTTWYLNGEDSQGLSYEKEVKANGLIENKHYVSAGGIVFALQVTRSGTLGTQTASSARYFHQDHLGSIAVITDETGAVVERLAYDPWGKRRNVNGNQDTLDAIVGLNTDRGYTMHEHLDEMGVVHMNGRIYDPLIGRMMSADPFIQASGDLQSYNRYAYVMNNPLALTDPSGYFSLKGLFKTFATIAVGYYTGQWALGQLGSTVTVYAGQATFSFVQASTAATIAAGAAGGFAAGAIGTGNLSGALQGAFSGGLFGAAGGVGISDSAERYLAHAAAGCISSAAGGGQCGQGAASALFGKYTTNATESWGPGIAQGSAAVIAGGVGSVIAGGKFENGAVTAAFGYLFNECAHSRACGSGGRDGYSGSSPVTDASGRLVIGGDGKPVLTPEGIDLGSFAQAGRSAGPIDLTRDLLKFDRGASWDLQRLDGSFQPRYIDAATVAIGVHAASAGIPLSVSLTIQNFVARDSVYAPGTVMDSQYRNLPARNVVNTQVGYDLVKSGRF